MRTPNQIGPPRAGRTHRVVSFGPGGRVLSFTEAPNATREEFDELLGQLQGMGVEPVQGVDGRWWGWCPCCQLELVTETGEIAA